MKVCDLTQFYSPFSGGVKRYLEEKRKYAVNNGHQHLLIIPGDQTSCAETENSRTYSIKSPLTTNPSTPKSETATRRADFIEALRHNRHLQPEQVCEPIQALPRV